MSEDIDPPFDYMKAVVGQSVGKFPPERSSRVPRLTESETVRTLASRDTPVTLPRGPKVPPRDRGRWHEVR